VVEVKKVFSGNFAVLALEVKAGVEECASFGYGSRTGFHFFLLRKVSLRNETIQVNEAFSVTDFVGKLGNKRVDVSSQFSANA